ncbi:UNVERIFIED_CONTAM: hypothetical protein Slati_0442900 [Sesamum latifolium]|uniref:DDE Tnp4 domain-containing protein n=1 Tax=Sesamum latifolium TaxID=2727402 RepID=A0AAW2XVL4_9LAMI
MRSARTVSQHFHHVLIAVLRLHSLLLASLSPSLRIVHVLDGNGCLGALDGTYIDVRVPAEDRARYRTRKGAADARVLRDSISRPNGLKIPRGNYYLVDSGYSNGEGFLSPYRGVRYHLKEWDSGRNSPQNHEEFFNMKHASARTVTERTFGLLKP